MARNNKIKKQVELAVSWIGEEIASTERDIIASVASKLYGDAHGLNEFKRGMEKALMYLNRVITSEENNEIKKEKKGE